MKKTLVSLALTSAMLALSAADITLPAPVKTGGKPVMEVFSARRTVRKFQEKELSRQQISDLLWAADGINRPDGKRTAPSAINSQEITLFVLLKDGSFRYDPAGNKLIEINRKDLRKLAGPRFDAPLGLLLISDRSRQVRMKSPEKRIHYSDVDAGYVSQNIYLFCAASGLGTVAVGGANDNGDAIRKALNLPAHFYPVLGHVVGFPK